LKPSEEEKRGDVLIDATKPVAGDSKMSTNSTSKRAAFQPAACRMGQELCNPTLRLKRTVFPSKTRGKNSPRSIESADERRKGRGGEGLI